MSEPTESFSGTDIDYVRVLLGQAGKEQMTVEIQEPQIAVTANKIISESSLVSHKFYNLFRSLGYKII